MCEGEILFLKSKASLEDAIKYVGEVVWPSWSSVTEI